MAEDSRLQIEKITGLPDEKRACGVFTKRINFSVDATATCVCCLMVEGDGFESQTELHELFETITVSIEEGTGILESLKRNGEAADKMAKEKAFKVSFVCAIFYKNVCYFLRYGDRVRAFVFDPSGEIEVKFEYGSGPTASGQVYLLGTEKFFSTFDAPAYFKENLDVDLEGVIDELATEISADNNQSEIGAALVYVKGAAAKGEGKIAGDKKHDDSETMVLASEVKTRGFEGGGDRLESALPAREAVEDHGDAVQKEGGRGIKFKNPLPGIARAIFSEGLKLKGGDIGAVLRLRRNLVIVAVLVFAILAGSAFFTIRGKMNNEKTKEFETHLVLATSKYTEAEAIVELNRAKARELFIEADREAKIALSIFSSENRAKELEAKIAQRLKDTESTVNVSFSDFATLSGPIESISFYTKDIYGFVKGDIYQFDAEGKEQDRVSSKNNIDRAFVFDKAAFLLSGNNVFKVNLAQESEIEIANGVDGRDISVFLGNVYILSDEQILKYVPVEGGYAESVDYLEDNESFSDFSRLTIDGSVWVTRDDKVLKYTRGEKEDFEISGFSDFSGKFGEIFTDSDASNIYVIDRINSALLVISKEGVYKKAYQSSEFSRASDLVVDEAQGKMYIAVASKILVANLSEDIQ